MQQATIAASPLDIPVMPCPWCGDTDVKVIQGSTFRWRVAQCQTCGAQTGDVRAKTSGEGNLIEWEATAKAAALEEWNTRCAHTQACLNVVEERHNAKFTGQL